MRVSQLFNTLLFTQQQEQEEEQEVRVSQLFNTLLFTQQQQEEEQQEEEVRVGQSHLVVVGRVLHSYEPAAALDEVTERQLDSQLVEQLRPQRRPPDLNNNKK